MAKQNRRINVAKLEARELRVKLARETASTELAHRQARHARNERDDLEFRLRSLCRHFFIFTPTGRVAPRDFRSLPEPRLRARDLYHSEPSPFDEMRPVDLVHMILDSEDRHDGPDFARYIHFRVAHPDGPNLHHGYAVSREVLYYLRDQRGPEMLTEAILREFSAALFNELQKSRR